MNPVPLSSFVASETLPSDIRITIKKKKTDAEYISIPPMLSLRAYIPIPFPV
jgi:hypothetical protein